MGVGPCRPVLPPSLEWTFFLSLVSAASITPKGAEAPASRCIEVTGALVYFLLSEAIQDKISSP